MEARMIEELLSEKAEERRALFEEAAGIGLYRDRKTSTERRLEETAADLDGGEDDRRAALRKGGRAARAVRRGSRDRAVPRSQDQHRAPPRRDGGGSRPARRPGQRGADAGAEPGAAARQSGALRQDDRGALRYRVDAGAARARRLRSDAGWTGAAGRAAGGGPAWRADPTGASGAGAGGRGPGAAHGRGASH